MGELHVVNTPIASDAIARMRSTATGAAEFRSALHLLTCALLHEASRHLPTRTVAVETPLETTEGRVIDGEIVLVPILRAGLGMLDAASSMLPNARVGFLGLRRNELTLSPEEYYRNLPIAAGATLVVLDPMLATGGSLNGALDAFASATPLTTIVLSVIAAPEGVRAVQERHPKAEIYTGALDRELNEHGYICPGLGDAGDRMWHSILSPTLDGALG